MSKRFLRWIDVWIEDHVASGDGADIESHEARAQRFADKLLAEAVAGGFGKDEIAEEAGKVRGLIAGKLTASVEFDISTFGAAPPDD
jgi:hypothetical protein